MQYSVASNIMARTTLDLDPRVLEKLKRRCAAEHKSMGTVASELLARSLSETTNKRQTPKFTWVAKELGVPKVDLEDAEAVRRILAR